MKVWIGIYTCDFSAQPVVLQYLDQGTFALIVWDHLITLSDEVEYVWKKERSWGKPRRICT